MARAQASYVDVMVLVLAVLLILAFFSAYMGRKQLDAQAKRFDAAYNNRLIMTMLRYDLANRTVADYITFYACSGSGVAKSVLDENIPKLLSILHKPRTDYILYAKFEGVGGLYYYNKQATVCLSDLTMTTHDIKLPCASSAARLYYGSWPDWQEVPEHCY